MFLCRPVKYSSLIRYSAPEMTDEYFQQQTFESHPRADIWRSETILVVFTDIWLNNDQVMDQGSATPSKVIFTISFVFIK